MGSVGLFFYSVLINSHANIHDTATVEDSDFATATAATRAYNAATAKGVMSGFDARNTNFNPYERVLKITCVSHLVLDWTTSTGDIISISPTVADGIVYMSSKDGKLFAVGASIGKSLWAISTKSGSVYSFTVAYGIVYVDSVLSTSCNDEVIFPEKWGRGMFFRPLFVKNHDE